MNTAYCRAGGVDATIAENPGEDELSKRKSRREQLPAPATGSEPASVVWLELERLFNYYDRGASVNRLAYFALRGVVLVAGALVPILVLATSNDVVVASLGATIAVAEGTTQLTQVHGHWIRYRRSAEALRHEAFAYVSSLPPYDAIAATRDRTLAARVLDLLGDESNHWEQTVRSTATASAKTAP